MPAKRPVSKPTGRGAARLQYAKVPRKTTAEDPAAYSKTPHEYGDVLIRPDEKGRTKLGGALQRDLVYWIERHTWGKNVGASGSKVERPEFAKLSLSQLAKLCGSDRRSVARSLADLADRGIIEARDRQGCGPTVAKMYKLTPAKWKKARYYEPPKLAEEDAAEEDAAAKESAEIEASAELEATVNPGRVSKPQAVDVSPTKGAPAVRIRIVYRPVDFPFPVAFSSRPGRNGRLQVSCRATTLHRFATPSPSVADATVDIERFNAYSESIRSIVLDIWGKEADERLIESIFSVSATAPVWLFESLIEQKFPKRRNPKHHTTGLLIELAKEAARGQVAREKSDAAAEARRQQQTSARYSVLTPEELAELDARIDAEMKRPL